MHRIYGLTLLTERNDFMNSRVALFKSINTWYQYLFELKVLSGIILTYFTGNLSMKIIKLKRKGLLNE
jgi:hypothetical protein